MISWPPVVMGEIFCVGALNLRGRYERRSCMFGFGLWELLLVGAVVIFALFSGRNISSLTRQAGQLTGLWFRIKRKLSFFRFLK